MSPDRQAGGSRVGAESSKKPPVLSKVTARLDKAGSLKLDWKLDREPRELAETWVRWSNDGGRTWRALTVGQKGNSVIINPEQLPSGDITFQLLAHDGFYTVSAVTESVTLPPKPPAVAILYPQESSLVYAERQMHLFGVVSSFAGYTIEDDHVAWYVDEKLVSRGRDAWVPNPGTGRHEVRIEATEQDRTGSATTTIDVSPGESEPAT